MNIGEITSKIRDASIQNKLVIFIGAGVSKNSGYKLWNEFVRDIDAEIKYSVDDKQKYGSEELLKIPQFLFEKDKNRYKKIVVDTYGWKAKQTNPIVDILLKLKPHHIITTNFDSLIELSLSTNEIIDTPIDGQLEKYTCIKRDSDLINAKRNNLLIKMHGDTDSFDELVLKEDDYLEYSFTHSFIETYIKSLLINHTFLFVGYGVGDYNLKLIMSWVENTAKKYSGDIKRKEYFFINSTNERLNAYDTQYFEKRNIWVIEPSELPSVYKNKAVENIESIYGKNVYRCCDFLLNGSKTIGEVSQVLNKLKPLEKFESVTFKDILAVCDLDNYPFYAKIGSTLYVDYIHENEYNAIKVIFDALINRNEDIYIKDIVSILAKAGINKIESFREKLSFICNDDKSEDNLFNAVFNNNYSYIRKVISENPIEIKGLLKHSYVNMFLGNRDAAEMLLKDTLDLCKQNNDFFNQLVCGLNFLKLSMDIKYPQKLIEILPKEILNTFKTMVDYFDGYNDWYAHATRICKDILEKYNKHNTGLLSESFIQNFEFHKFRTSIFDTLRYFIKNNIYTYGELFWNVIHGSLDRILSLYVETILTLTSKYSSVKIQQSIKGKIPYEKLQLMTWDIYILINYIDLKKIKLYIEENKIKKLELVNSNETKSFILSNLHNLSMELVSKISDGEIHNTYIANKLEIILRLVKLIECSNFEADIIIGEIHLILKYLYREKSDYFHRIYHSLIMEIQQTIFFILEKCNNKGKHIDIVSEIILDLISLIDKNLDINKIEIYSNALYETNIIFNLSNILEYHKKTISSDSLVEFINALDYSYYDKQRILWTCIYNICDDDIKDKIQTLLLTSIDKLSTEELYFSLIKKAIPINIEILKRFKMLCERYVKSDVKSDVLNDDGDITKPLHALARLKEAKIINDLSGFEVFAAYNNFFSFVCFPEKFNYNSFKIGWYSWLTDSNYAKIALEKAKDILTKIFEDEMDNDPSDDFKSVYYKLFYDLQN